MNIVTLITKTLSSILALMFSVSFSLGTAVGFTDGAPINATRRQYDFDNSGLLIGGYNFSMANANETQVGYIEDCGIDFIISGANDTYLDLCAAHGIGVIAKGYNASPMYYKTYGNTSWHSISPSTYRDHPALWGDDMIDEPTSAEFATLQSFSAHYYANTQGKIALINLFPIYANSEQLGNEADIPPVRQALPFLFGDAANSSVDRYKRHVSDYINTIDTDYISVDIYPLGQETVAGETVKTTNGLWLRNLDILAEACRATDRDLWVITQAAGNTGEGGGMRYCDTPADIRWQAFVTLSFGAKAIIHACYNTGWWDTDSHLIDAAGNRTDTYYAAQTVNNELREFADIYGDYSCRGAFLNKAILAAGTDTGYLLPVDKKYKPGVESNAPLLIGCFEANDSAGAAFTVVNMYEPGLNLPAKATLDFGADKTITVYQKGIATVTTAGEVTLNLESGEGVFVTVG